ncbi:MAG: 16S rRNA (uracil(1498)-N(3))-methyltransferase [Leptolyngbya sp. DLM2.Bin15]|nr:MAG: 16S rRNA (uracil(1498)-N(3))-methyltransferase [Leptolyngbya sp. DLM2.Bin15]
MAQLQRVAIAPDQQFEDHIQLTDAQGHYLQRVLRLQVGDRFIAMDGNQWWLAEIQDGFRAKMLEVLPVAADLCTTVTLIMAMPKQGMDDIVRQATELGVSTIVPVQSDRTLLKPSAQKLDRWQRIVQEAAEQSERQQIPRVIAPQGAIAALGSSTASHRYICTARGDRPSLLAVAQRDRKHLQEVAIAVGPEGGWSEAEVREAIACGYQPVSLGRHILRAVTAPLVALSILTAVLEDESL